MRLPRRAHATAIIVLTIAAVAWAQPGPPTDPFAPLPPPKGAVVVEATAEGSNAPKPAGSSPVESSDVPDVAASPPRFAVAPFENRANVRAFDWYQWGAPFEIAEKVEGVLGLESTGGPLFVSSAPVPAEATAIAAFAKSHDATWVVTGWVERPNWELRIAISLWKVNAGLATRMHEAVRQGKVETYHALLGDALAEAWTKAGIKVDDAKLPQLSRPLAIDLYAVSLMSRGLGHLVAALAMPTATSGPADVVAQQARANQLKLAQHDLERSVFIDPKCFEAQRLVGELYAVLAQEQKDPKLANKAAGKFAYANDLAPDDLQSLRAAASSSVRAGKAEVSLPLFEKLVRRRPWDLEARYQYGSALWQTGDAARAEHQLEQVTAKKPDHLLARRVLVLIHAARSETHKLVRELEAIAARVPDDLDVKEDLATAYGSLGDWARSTAQLEAIAAARAPDVALLVRIGDGYRRMSKLDPALAWYARAQKVAPESSYAGFIAAQSLVDAGRLPEAARAYTSLQRYADDKPYAEQALGVIALARGNASEAAWYLRKCTREAPRDIRMWRALIASELARKDFANARSELDRALPHWPDDGHLHYLSGIAAGLAGDRALARRELSAATVASPELAPARTALSLLDSGGTPQVAYTPELIRPWGDSDAVQVALDRYALTTATMTAVRLAYQTKFLSVLGALGRGPYAPVKAPPVRTCPVARIAPAWADAQKELRKYERLGVELETLSDWLARHAAIGAGAGLLPNSRTQLANARKVFKTALADVTELRAELTRGLGPELRVAGCNDKLLAAAIANPERYRVVVEEKVPEPPATQPQRPRARATFYVDNTRCVDAVDVWIDGAQLGQVSPGRRSALVADAGEHTLCLLLPGSAQCGDRGTVRQIYLHDGWSVTMHCPK